MDVPPEPLARLLTAIEGRDVEAIADCFAESYRNETPAHPDRGFTGRAQVRRNWEQILGGVHDLEARVDRWVADGDTLWTEWSQSGTRPDGSAFLVRGVVVFELAGDRIAAARFYLEPVESGGEGIDATVRRQVRGAP
jgi:ketosteroid isomerase-like protein